MSAFDDLLATGGEVGKQLFVWGVIFAVVNQVGQPYLRDLTYLVNEHNPNVELSPQELADMVVRAIKTQDQATAEAKRSGFTPERFANLVHSAGEPPGIESVLQWYRRGLVPFGKAGPGEVSVANAIATSRIYTYWSTVIKAANVVPIPAAEAVDALVENQIERGTRENVNAAAGGEAVTGLPPAATTFYEIMWANGLTPDQADVLFNTRGNPPSPTELFTLFRRGVIPKTGTGPDKLTVQQGIFEGATKDKWWPTVAELIRQIPSEFYLKLMLTTGTISPALGTKLLQELGYTTEVVSGIVGAATAAQVSTYRKLTESIIVKLYQDLAISRTQAKQFLVDIKFGEAAATFVLQSADLTRVEKALSGAITKIGTRFIAHKLNAQQAAAALAQLDIPASQATALLATWTVERTTTVKLLTATEVVDGWAKGNITLTAAKAYLVSIGYTPFDAWVLLANKTKATAGPEPPRLPTTFNP